MSDGLYFFIMVEKFGCKVWVFNYYFEIKVDREVVFLVKEEVVKFVETVILNFIFVYCIKLNKFVVRFYFEVNYW